MVLPLMVLSHVGKERETKLKTGDKQSFSERYGMVVNQNRTFAGLINSYVNHFRKAGQTRSLWVTECGLT